MSLPERLARSVAQAEQAPAPSPTFAFVKLLARELSDANLELPGFPDVVLRVRKVLSDDSTSTRDVVRVIGSDPSLATRLLQIANSAAYSNGSEPVTDLRSAVGRLGYNLVRTASVAFAMSQMRRAEELRGLEARLNALWQTSVQVSSLCCVIARRSELINPDEAMLAGLMHAVGRLYILTRARRFPELLSDDAHYLPVVQDWHATIAAAILDTWRMPQSIVEAVKAQDELVREHRGGADLSDILIVAANLAAGADGGAALEASLGGVSSAGRVQAFTGPFAQLLLESEAEIRATRNALGA